MTGNQSHECRAEGEDFLQRAPFRLLFEEEVNASPAQVFDALADANAWSEWAKPVEKVEWTSPEPHGVGSTRTMDMGGVTLWEEFLVWEPGKRTVHRSSHTSESKILALVEEYRITELDGGRCRVQWLMALETGGFSRFLQPLIRPLMRVTLRRMFRQFRHYVEQLPASERAA